MILSLPGDISVPVPNAIVSPRQLDMRRHERRKPLRRATIRASDPGELFGELVAIEKIADIEVLIDEVRCLNRADRIHYSFPELSRETVFPTSRRCVLKTIEKRVQDDLQLPLSPESDLKNVTYDSHSYPFQLQDAESAVTLRHSDST
jgi:hypothetical protein